MTDAVSCRLCGAVFPRPLNEVEMRAEAKANFGSQADKPCSIVCDKCYKKVMQWYKVKDKE